MDVSEHRAAETFTDRGKDLKTLFDSDPPLPLREVRFALS